MNKRYVILFLFLLSQIFLFSDDILITNKEYVEHIKKYFAYNGYSQKQINDIFNHSCLFFNDDIYIYDIIMKEDLNNDGIVEYLLFKELKYCGGTISIIHRGKNDIKMIYFEIVDSYPNTNIRQKEILKLFSDTSKQFYITIGSSKRRKGDDSYIKNIYAYLGNKIIKIFSYSYADVFPDTLTKNEKTFVLYNQTRILFNDIDDDKNQEILVRSIDNVISPLGKKYLYGKKYELFIFQKEESKYILQSNSMFYDIVEYFTDEPEVIENKIK